MNAPTERPSAPTSDSPQPAGTSSPADSPDLAPAKPKLTQFQIFRETLESLAIAFVLALLFKAFVAEAFVIPTGSMAPTLMGAHKDVQCNECGYQFQCGASNEYSADTGARENEFVFGVVCPLCRKPQILDLERNKNHQTFSGDRILVSKLAYMFGTPQRWNVFVFKHLEDARLNYIKRCIGRPNESVRIDRGDIYIRSPETRIEGRGDGFEIASKPPHVLQGMLQLLSDTRYQAASLIEARVPDAWSGDSKWTIQRDANRWQAQIEKAPTEQHSMLRYRHRVLDPVLWDAIATQGALPKPIPEDDYRLVSDFTAYNASMVLFASNAKLPSNYRDTAPLEARRAMRQGFVRPYSRPMENDGLHWTGDLCGEWSIQTEPSTKELRLVLVEAGVEHECIIDLDNGNATARLLYDGNPLKAFHSKDSWETSLLASTPLRAGSSARIKFANVDDALTLWINGRHIPWGEQGKFSIDAALPDFVPLPKTTPENPLDAAPVAIGVRAGGCTIERAQVYRDIYYIAHQSNQGLTDYDDVLTTLRNSAPPNAVDAYIQRIHTINREQYRNTSTEEALGRNAILSDANAFAASPMGRTRRTATFDLASDAYFPMGDNSSASNDARSWYKHHVPQRLLIGRAVMVFWPHYWNAPIPFLPNFQRMGLIR
ncbi:MAG: S26 family signal peptidase [Pirellula sp.]